MSEPEPLRIRPYARLLTMLGEQLIKNERIALIELIKNSYDADATWVKVSFKDFGANYEITDNSKIIIEDDGQGMSADIIEQHWLNPATPEKKLRKQIKDTTDSGRIIQGEKGIGRFAILKLGRKVQVTSRTKNSKFELVVEYDFSAYDDDFLVENGKPKVLFIDDLSVHMRKQDPASEIIKKSITLSTKKIDRKPYGTRIEISNLKGSWSDQKIEKVYSDIARLESIFVDGADGKAANKTTNFSVYIYKEDKLQRYHENYLEKLHVLLNDKAVFRIENGLYNEDKQEFEFSLNGVPRVLKLSDPSIKGFKIFQDHFGKGGEVLNKRKTECGSFNFSFYVFDFSDKVPLKYALDKEDKKIVRNHRIYLYRDGIRVYPYGEPDDDWLRIDMLRGTIGAGHFLSNDQVVGCVNITQKHNPTLKDKTNREGLIYEGNATDDFIVLIQSFLTFIRRKSYAQYRLSIDVKKVHDIFKTEQIQADFAELKEAAKDNKTIFGLLVRAEKAYRAEHTYLVQRAETTEDLAAVGLSVETASHDVMSIMGKAMNIIDGIIRDALHGEEIDGEELQKELQSLRGMLSFIEAQLSDLQLLFKSSKQRRRSIKVKETLDKVERIYRSLLKKEHIGLQIITTGSPLIAKTTDAVLLQLFINLFDNAVYWLQQVSIKEKKIEVRLDGNKGQLVFSDNGPGVTKEDAPYIFEPFYSGKGEEGRGLGLYIARQLLERNDYAIELAELKSERILSGANFIVSFISEEI